LALGVTDRAGVEPRPQPKHEHTDTVLQPYVALVCRFNDLHFRSSCKYMDYDQNTDPLSAVGWPSVPKVITCEPLIGTDQGSPPAKDWCPNHCATCT